MYWGLQHSLVLGYLQLSLHHLLCLPLHLGQHLMIAWWTFLHRLLIPNKEGTNQPMHAWSIHQKCRTVDNCPKSHGTMPLQSFHCLFSVVGKQYSKRRSIVLFRLSCKHLCFCNLRRPLCSHIPVADNDDPVVVVVVELLQGVGPRVWGGRVTHRDHHHPQRVAVYGQA